jgi:hypothetical protein
MIKLLIFGILAITVVVAQINSTCNEWTDGELKDRKRVLSVGFTDDEADAWLSVNRGAAKMLLLPELHPSDRKDIADAVHILQNMLMLRPTYKKYWHLGQSTK